MLSLLKDFKTKLCMSSLSFSFDADTNAVTLSDSLSVSLFGNDSEFEKLVDWVDNEDNAVTPA